MTSPTSEPPRRRLDLFRRDAHVLCIAKSPEGSSLGLVWHGGLAAGEPLGPRVLPWLEAARALAPQERPLTYPDDLLPAGWDVYRWHLFMATAHLCSIEPVTEGALLRPYKNLYPIGDEFSHDGYDAFTAALDARSLHAAVDRAFTLAERLSRVRRNPHADSAAAALAPAVLDQLARLGATLLPNPPREEAVEVAEGLFVLPKPVHQLVFDVRWHRQRPLQDAAGQRLHMGGYPMTDRVHLGAYPLIRLAQGADHQVVMRLDDPRPDDPAVYRLGPEPDAAELTSVLGAAEGPAAAGQALSEFLAGLEPAPNPRPRATR